MAPAWKVGWVQALGGSNPPFSAKYEWRLLYGGAIRMCCNCADSGRRNGGTISTESPILRIKMCLILGPCAKTCATSLVTAIADLVILRGHDLDVFKDGVAL